MFNSISIKPKDVSNTTTYRSNTLISKNKKEIGGLSGPPLFSQSTKMLAKAYLHASKSIKFIGIGGISNGETAYSKILAGANIIQLYTGLVFHGPQIINDIINYLLLGGIAIVIYLVVTKKC